MKDTKNLLSEIQGNTELLTVIKMFRDNNQLTVVNVKHSLNIFGIKGDFKKTKVNYTKLIKLLTGDSV